MLTANHILGSLRKAACAAAATALESNANNIQALVGFDGFVDVILRAVAMRQSMRTEDFDPIESIPAFANRINAATGKSAGIELVTTESRFGGNGPLLAGGLASLGARTTYIGCIASDTISPSSDPSAKRSTHPLFTQFAHRCEKVIPLAPPALTHALEFCDGKIMFNMPDSIQRVTWDTLVGVVGLDQLTHMFERSSLIAIVNWSIMAGVQSILEGVCAQVLPKIAASNYGRRMFVDLSDPSKRTREDIVSVLTLLTRLNSMIPVTLGLNLNEAELIHASLDSVAAHSTASTVSTTHSHAITIPDRSLNLARSIRESLALSTVVVHPREGAAAATTSDALWIDGPFTPTPALSTGAGDHFGAGFSLAQSMNLPLDACLAMAVACSGAYVRDANSPSAARLAAFLRAGW